MNNIYITLYTDIYIYIYIYKKINKGILYYTEIYVYTKINKGIICIKNLNAEYDTIAAMYTGDRDCS